LGEIDILLLEGPDGQPRQRRWEEPLGIPNLMQGSDANTGYPGDRHIHNGRPQLQIHRVRPRHPDAPDELFTLALYIPENDRLFPSSIVTQV
jgi:hypothetical protein